MNKAFMGCMIAAAAFLFMALIFAVLKGKAAVMLAGFESVSKKDRDKYDIERMSRDARNKYFVWTLIMVAGALVSLVTVYGAAVAVAVLLVLSLKDLFIEGKLGYKKYLKGNYVIDYFAEDEQNNK